MAHLQPIFKLNALIIDPNLGSRIRLKEALSALPRFSTVMPLNSLREATENLKAGKQNYDIIFIAQIINHDETALFIKSARGLPSSQDTAFVNLLKLTDGGDMAGSMLIGFDGMLAEPYSVNSLNDICELAMRVKRERSASREKVALSLMVSDVSKHLDAVAVLRSCGYESVKGMEKLRDACSNFKHLSPDAVKSYEDVAERVFGEARPAKAPENKYAGVSKRIKNRQVSKIIDGEAAAPADKV